MNQDLHRRHLTDSQRAMVAANLANMKIGENQHKGGSANLHTLSPTVSVPKAAEMLNVGSSNVHKAKLVQRV